MGEIIGAIVGARMRIEKILREREKQSMRELQWILKKPA